jgi:hypothetical protein
VPACTANNVLNCSIIPVLVLKVNQQTFGGPNSVDEFICVDKQLLEYTLYRDSLFDSIEEAVDNLEEKFMAISKKNMLCAKFDLEGLKEVFGDEIN